MYVWLVQKGYKGYKGGLQPESLADDGNWLVKQNQPVSKIETKSDKLIQKSPRRSWAILKLRWEDQLAVLCAKADKMFKRTVQQNVFLILSRVPVTDPELIRPSIPVMFFGPESYGQKGEGKKVHG